MNDQATNTHVDDPQPLKFCRKCGNSYPETTEYFYLRDKTANRLMTTCKHCRNKYARANAEQGNKRKRDWRKEHPGYESKNRKRSDRKQTPYKPLTPERAAERREYARAYREANKDHINAMVRELWRTGETRRLKHKEKQRRYRNEHHEKVLEIQRAHYRKQKEEGRLKSKASLIRRAANKRNLPNTFTSDDLRYCLEYWRHSCAVCGRTQGLWHRLSMDHWIALSKGGGTTPENIVPLCSGFGGCNQSKWNRDPHEWLIYRLGKKAAMKKLLEIQSYFDSIHSRQTGQ